jgi:small subunit ribosomal protein S3
MGQKVNPIGFRVGVYQTWKSRWYADKKQYPGLLHEDIKIRALIKKKLYFTGVPRILIHRASNQCRVTIFTARPGIVIGRKGSEIEKLKSDIAAITAKEIQVDIEEIKTPELEAQLVAENIAQQLERRVSYRRAMKKALSATLAVGAEGIKIQARGRLGGGEIARVEKYKYGKVPLHTLRANIDYGFAEAHTTVGVIGVKVWIGKGEVETIKSSGVGLEMGEVGAKQGLR